MGWMEMGKIFRRIIHSYKKASGDFLDGSKESLKEAFRAMKIWYTVLISSGVAVGATICIVVISTR